MAPRRGPKADAAPMARQPRTNRGGRPRFEVTDRQIKEIERAAADGVRESTIAILLGMAERTFRDLKARDPRVSAAVEMGMAKLERVVGSTLARKARRGDLGAAIWLEKSRFNRHERHVVQTQELPPVRVVRE